MKKILSLLFVVLCILSSCKKNSERFSITVFHAGSLAKPFKEMKNAFEKKYPKVQVLLEAAGSRASARKITDHKRLADVMASADESVIRTLLMPQYSDWVLHFVTNEMVIVYSDKSKYAKEINRDNWYDVLLKDGVNYGHSEPDIDPCGYRTMLTWQLAQKYYKKKGLYKKLQNKRPEKHIRPKETDLLALLEAGELDYIFIYRSVATQHGYKYVILPDEINLGSADKAGIYASSSIALSGKKPGEKIIKKGAPMVYGITVPKNAQHKKWGEKFVEFVISAQGGGIMKRNGHPVIAPPETKEFDQLPKLLQRISEKI